ncbi:MAG: hypothetical protein AB7K09_25055 [Planctomycetota bacterium]
MLPPSVLCPNCHEPVYATDATCPGCQREIGGQTRRILRNKQRSSRGGGGEAAYMPDTAAGGRSAIGSRTEWLGVRDGLAMNYNGILILLIAAVATVVLAIGMGFLGMAIGLLGIVAGAVMIIIGMFKCLATPESSGLRPKIVWSVSLWCIGVVATVIQSVLNYQAGGSSFAAAGNSDPMVSATIGAIQVASNVLFMFYLRDVANYFGNYSLSNSAQSLAILAIVVGVLQLVVGATTPAPVPGRPVTPNGLAMLAGLGALVMLIWSIIVIKGTRDTLTDRVERVRFARAV